MYSTNSLNSNDPIFSSKQPVKFLEVPIQKFNSVVPHFLNMLKVHQNNISKLKRLNQWEEMKREQTAATRTVKKLTSMLNEMDNLRTQVINTDLSKFDKLINNSKQSAISAIQSQKEISVPVSRAHYTENDDEDRNELANKQEQQLQIVADISEQIKQQEQYAASMERLEGDIDDINSMFQELSQLVHEQGESVEKIEEHVETTHHNVVEGESMLRQAAKYKNSMYPLLGAIIGSVMGGPVGLLAGLKLGGLTAVGCGALGFTGGKILTNGNKAVISEAERYSQETMHEETTK